MLGRPKKPLAERRRNKVQVAFTDAELNDVERAAGDEATGSWITAVAVKTARKKGNGSR